MVLLFIFRVCFGVEVGDVADSEEEEGEEKEEKIASSPDVETSILFTTGSDKGTCTAV